MQTYDVGEQVKLRGKNMKTAKQINDNLTGIANVFVPMKVEGVISEDVCTKCRSRIEAETRQKCWDDLCEKLSYDYSEQYWILYGARLQELKRKWRVK